MWCCICGDENHKDFKPEIGDRLWDNDDYTTLSKLGKGAFGTVLKAETRDGTIVAVKIIPKYKKGKPIDLKQLEKEVLLLKRMKHANVVGCLEVLEDWKQVYVVQDFLSGCDLRQRYMRTQRRGESLSFKLIANVMKQVLEALKYMHSLRVSHCDLKPANIMFTSFNSTQVKVIDFGLSTVRAHFEFSKLPKGSLYYMGPEVLDGHYDDSADIWSVGVIAFEMMYGFVPFEGSEFLEIVNLIREGFDPDIMVDTHQPKAAKDFVVKLLNSNSMDRPTAEEALMLEFMDKDENNFEMYLTTHLNDVREMSETQKLITEILLKNNDKYGTKEIMAKLEKAWPLIDTDSNNQLSRQELKTLFERTAPTDACCDEDKVTELIKLMDRNNDGVVDKIEFFKWFEWDSIINQDTRFYNMIQDLDLNNDGEITYEELIEGIEKSHMGFILDDEQLAAIRSIFIARSSQYEIDSAETPSLVAVPLTEFIADIYPNPDLTSHKKGFDTNVFQIHEIQGRH